MTRKSKSVSANSNYEIVKKPNIEEIKLSKVNEVIIPDIKKEDDIFDQFKKKMNDLGFKTGNSFDAPLTKLGIKTFQKFNGLKITHELDEETKNKLGL